LGSDTQIKSNFVIVLLLAVVLFCVGIFVWFQYRQKRVSVMCEEELEKYLSKSNNSIGEEIENYFNTARKINRNGAKHSKFDILVESAMFVLLAALYVLQIVAISI
jgi:hypothetical protein